WSDGGAGTEALAHVVTKLADSGTEQFRTLYEDSVPLWQKARTIARKIYGAEDIIADGRVRQQFADYEEAGFGHLPICMAKTQYSFSADPKLFGEPSDHVVGIREVRLASVAGFLACICEDILTMPGLRNAPASASIRLDDKWRIDGFF